MTARPPAIGYESAVDRRLLPIAPLFSAVLFATGCGAGGDYGFARTYRPLGEEDDYLEQASEVSYEEVRRDPADYRESMLSWFGIVTGVEGSTVHMTYRTHQERHLCRDETSRSCRVTVSERPGGAWSAVLQMRAEDQDGQERIWNGSLLRIYGSPNGEFDSDGGPIVQATYYRHWPRGTYVTTGASGVMRR